MQETMRTLERVHHTTSMIEEQHNEVLDTHADMQLRIRELDEELRAELVRIQRSILELRTQIHERITKAKRATLLLSLIAQKEEIGPIENRINKQPYELYATKDWFASALGDRSKRS